MTRVWPGVLACMFMSTNQIQWIARFIQVIEYALQHHGVAQLRLAGTDFIQRQPVGGNDALIQRLLRLESQRRSGKAGALVGHAIAALEQIHAGDAGYLNGPGRFFQGFPLGGFDKTFVGFQMASGLIEYDTITADFFHHEIPALIFYNGGDGNMRYKAHNNSRFRATGYRKWPLW